MNNTDKKERKNQITSIEDLKKGRNFEKVLEDLVINPNHDDYRYITYQLYKVSVSISNLEALIAELRENLKNKEAELYLQIKEEEQKKLEEEYQKEVQKIEEEEKRKEEIEEKGGKVKRKKTLPPKPKKTLPSKEIEMMVQVKLKEEKKELLKYEKELKIKKNKYDAITKLLKSVDSSLFYLNNNKNDIL